MVLVDAKAVHGRTYTAGHKFMLPREDGEVANAPGLQTIGSVVLT